MAYNAAWSNWGWKNPTAYQGQGYQLPGSISGSQGGTSYGGGGQTMTNPLWSQYMQGQGAYQPQTGTYQQPGAMPYDQYSMSQYFIPAAQAQQQATLAPQIAGQTTAARIGEKQKVAQNMGWTTSEEATPTMANAWTKQLQGGLQSLQGSQARSGMPISSVSANAQSEAIQSSLEGFVRAYLAAKQSARGGLMQYMS